jgi:hypothetical protein
MYDQYPTYSSNSSTKELPEGLTIKEKLAFGLAGIIVLGGAIILVRKMVSKQQADAEQKLTYQEGSTATLAKQIKMAFDNDGWFGTNTEALRNTMRRIPSREVFRQTMNSYQKLYNSSLLRDMESELQLSEYNEMLAIISAKPEKYNASSVTQQLTSVQYQGWAARLKAAFDKSYGFIPGTDEAAIKAVFNEIPTQAAFVQVGVAYKGLYGRDLITDLKGELEFWEYTPYLQIIYQKPKV